MKLLKEVNEAVNVQILAEGTDPSAKKYYIEGIFIQGDKENRNGRKYPMHVLESEIERYAQEHIQKNRAYGELGHPDSPTIQLERVSHMIRSLKRDGTNYIGKAEILSTPNGKIVKSLIDAGAQLGVSSRGVGSLKTEGMVNIVQDDFRLMTAADIVADPSAPDAFVSAMMEEKEWVWNNGILIEKQLAESKKKLLRTPKKDLNEERIRAFKDFLSKL
jgi:hypothetical protein